MKKYLRYFYIVVSLIIYCEVTLAATTTSFQVTANIVDACTVATPTAIAFGSYVFSANSDQTTTINVTCTNGTTYKIGLDAGQTSGATVNTRKMKGTSTHTLNYNLTSVSVTGANWGNTPGTDTVNGTGNGNAQPYVVFGRIPSGQNTAFVDSYTDTIAVTITFP